MKRLLIFAGLLVLMALPVPVRAYYFANESVIQPTATNTLYHVADYYNAPALTFDSQPARMISLGGRILHIEAGQALNATVTNYSASGRWIWLTNTTANPATDVNASGFAAGWTVDVLADGAYVNSYAVNASGWVNFIFQSYSGPATLLQFNQTPPTDITPPTFSNVINHTHTANTSFSYDVDATDASGLDSFTLNGTNFIINSATGVITNNTVLNTTFTEWLNITVNDTVGNLAWEVFYINITEPSIGGALGLLEGKFYQEKWFVYTYIEMPRSQESAMPTDSVFWSTDRYKLVYKDPNGVVHGLY